MDWRASSGEILYMAMASGIEHILGRFHQQFENKRPKLNVRAHSMNENNGPKIASSEERKRKCLTGGEKGDENLAIE